MTEKTAPDFQPIETFVKNSLNNWEFFPNFAIRLTKQTKTMSNYSLSVCLSDLPGAQVQANQNGKQFLFVPIEDADLYLSERGKVYLSLSMWEKRGGPDQYGKTHGVKQSPSQGLRQRIGDEAAKNLPFIGSAKEIAPKGQGGYQQQQPVYQQAVPQGYAQPAYPQAPANPFPPANDLAF